MAITATLKRVLSDATGPVYATAGFGDLTVGTLRRVPDRVRAELHPRVVGDRVAELRVNVAALPRRTGVFARGRLTQLAGRYDDLAERGRMVVHRFRRQDTVQQLEQRAQRTLRPARATRAAAGTGSASTSRAGTGNAGAARRTARAAARTGRASADQTGE
jgi:hypothetical protein